MEPMTLPGTYSDGRGSTSVTWTIASSTRPGWDGRFEVTGTVRGVRVSGPRFGALECDGPSAAVPVNAAGELARCIVTAQVPVIIRGVAPGQSRLVIEFRLGGGIWEPIVGATLTVGGAAYRQEREEILEVVLGDLARQAEPARWECCLACLLSDYSPGGVDLMGMRCHRNARARYLAVRSKRDYWGVPVTEEVPEFYHCDSYEPRVPGTGYRSWPVPRRSHSTNPRPRFAADQDDHSSLLRSRISAMRRAMSVGA